MSIKNGALDFLHEHAATADGSDRPILHEITHGVHERQRHRVAGNACKTRRYGLRLSASLIAPSGCQTQRTHVERLGDRRA